MFVGRDEEIARIEALLRGGARLVTLWGPGGAGKTTLARRVAPGAAWIDLSAAHTRDDVLAALAAALGVETDEAAVRRAAETRGERLVLDNVEQIEGEGRALLVGLATHAQAALLVTSRDALGVPEEAAVEIAPLPEDDALALYTQLSGAPADEDARAIVTRLDALPLAIELAAARAPLLGSAALRSRLDRSFDVLKDGARVARHATLHAAIAWSWDLLDGATRDALVVLAQFEAPFDAALAEDAIGEDALDVLETLRKRALLRIDEGHERASTSGPRLRLFESVRAFARHVPNAAAFDRYARAVVARVEPLALAVRRGAAVDDELIRRRPDLTAVGASAAPVAGRALLALAALRSVTGPHDFGAAGPRRVEALPDGVCMLGDESVERGLGLRLVIAKGVAARAAGDLEIAEASARWALEVAPDDADALRLAGMVARSRGETDRAVTLLERARTSYRAAGEEAFAGLTLGELGAARQSVSDLADGIAILVATKSERAEGLLRSHLAVITHRRGDPRAAVPLHEAALAIHRRVGNRRLEGAELLHLGFVRHEIADIEAARASFDEARRKLAEAGAIGLEALALVLRARLDVDAKELVAARIALAEAARITPPGWHRLVATHRVVAGHLALAEGDRAAAGAHYAQALSASADVEVGFEALTPAYRAYALGEPPPERPALASPHLVHAWNVLGGTTTSAPPEAIASSSEVRRAIAFAGTRTLIVTATSLVLPDGRTIDLSKRKNLRLIVAELARTSSAWVTPEALVATGWPGERMRAEAATKRLHTAIWTLRKLGLEGVLQSSEHGYRFDPAIALQLRLDG